MPDTQDQYVDESVLNKINLFVSSIWNSFLEEEFANALIKCNVLSTSGPNKLI